MSGMFMVSQREAFALLSLAGRGHQKGDTFALWKSAESPVTAGICAHVPRLIHKPTELLSMMMIEFSLIIRKKNHTAS
jgi:hypothetical protein